MQPPPGPGHFPAGTPPVASRRRRGDRTLLWVAGILIGLVLLACGLFGGCTAFLVALGKAIPKKEKQPTDLIPGGGDDGSGLLCLAQRGKILQILPSDDGVYVVDAESKHIVRLSPDGQEAKKLWSYRADVIDGERVAVDEQALYFYDTEQRAIVRAAKGSAGKGTPIAENLRRPLDIAVDPGADGRLYSVGRPPGSSARNMLWSVPKTGGDARRLVENFSVGDGLAVDDAHIYYTTDQANGGDHQARVWRIPRAGGEAVVLAIVPGNDTCRGLVVDTEHLHCATRTLGHLVTFPKAGGAGVVRHEGKAILEIHVDQGWLWASDQKDSGIMRYPKAAGTGSGAETVLPRTKGKGPTPMAVTKTHLYWYGPSPTGDEMRVYARPRQ